MIVLRRFPIKTLLYSMTGLVLLALIAQVAVLVHRWNEELQFVDSEKLGVAFIPAVQSVSLRLAQHRGTANMWLNGDSGAAERLQLLEGQLDGANAVLDEKCARSGDRLGAVCRQWAKLRDDWSGLKAEYRQMSARASFAAHSRLISRLLLLQTEVADSSKLTLDPVLETYYLMDNMARSLPALMESLGQVRGMGSGIGVSKAASQGEKIELAKLAHGVRVSLRNLQWGMEKVFSALPDLRLRWREDVQGMTEAVEHFLQVVDGELVYAETVRVQGEDFFNEATLVMDRVEGLYDPVVETLHSELVARGERLVGERNLSLGCAAFVLALMAGLLGYVIRRITLPLAQAAACCERIGQGDYQTPIEVQYQDELGRVLASARDMQSRLASYVQRLRQVADSLAEAQQIACLGNWDWNIVRDEAFWSDEVYRLFGANPGGFVPTYAAFINSVHPEDRCKVEHAINRTLYENAPYSIDHRIVRPDGSVRIVHARAETRCGPDGRPARMVGTIQDVTEQRQAEMQRRLASQVFEHSGEAILISDADNTILQVNPAFTAITGYAAEEVVGRNPQILASGRQETEFYAQMWASILDTGLWKGEMWNRRKNGEVYPEWLTINTIRDDEGKITHHIGIFSDITEHKVAQERIQFLAHYDPLTGLTNRALLQDRLRQSLAMAERRGRQVAVQFIDLDRFKAINDNYGHAHGDSVLQTVAERLRGCVRAEDTVARLGGDEFIIVLNEMRDGRDAVQVARKVLDDLSRPMNIKGDIVSVTPSIGIALYPDNGKDYETLITNADTAMYIAKGKGRNSYEFFAQDELARR